MAGRRLGLALVAVMALAALGPGHKYEREREDPKPEKSTRKLLPKGIRGFRGYLTGRVERVLDRAIRFRVERVRPMDGSKAEDPDMLVGQSGPLHYLSFKTEDGKYRPDLSLIKMAKKAMAKEAAVTVRVHSDDDAVLIFDRITFGLAEGQERADPPKEKRDVRPDKPREKPRGDEF
jgi:hypothetical protein